MDRIAQLPRSRWHKGFSTFGPVMKVTITVIDIGLVGAFVAPDSWPLAFVLAGFSVFFLRWLWREDVVDVEGVGPAPPPETPPEPPVIPPRPDVP